MKLIYSIGDFHVFNNLFYDTVIITISVSQNKYKYKT